MFNVENSELYLFIKNNGSYIQFHHIGLLGAVSRCISDFIVFLGMLMWESPAQRSEVAEPTGGVSHLLVGITRAGAGGGWGWLGLSHHVQSWKGEFPRGEKITELNSHQRQRTKGFHG